MTNYTELKRLAEAAKAAFSNSYEHTSNRVDFEMAASPDVVLSMIAEIDRLRCNAEVLQRLHDEDGIEHNKLRTQNQALREALTHAVEIAEARRNGTWDDLLQYRALIAQAEGGV